MRITSSGYGLPLEEAWWCCVHEAGMAMSEMARHVVTVRGSTLRVNFLFAGRYTVPLPGGKEAVVTIATDYPSKAEATIDIAGSPAEMPIRLRVPGCVRGAAVSEVPIGSECPDLIPRTAGTPTPAVGPGSCALCMGRSSWCLRATHSDRGS